MVLTIADGFVVHVGALAGAAPRATVSAVLGLFSAAVLAGRIVRAHASRDLLECRAFGGHERGVTARRCRDARRTPRPGDRAPTHEPSGAQAWSAPGGRLRNGTYVGATLPWAARRAARRHQ